MAKKMDWRREGAGVWLGGCIFFGAIGYLAIYSDWKVAGLFLLVAAVFFFLYWYDSKYGIIPPWVLKKK
ncbi:MAG: hypothetical protein KKG59_02440 [Nanoarchaeota archaeon]|nr:hypothetical protein [Nanoarchaeota archaeon]